MSPTPIPPRRSRSTSGHPPARLRDVAAAAQVSHAVVSKVLNGVRGNIKVSPATRQRVLNAASSLGYQPHFAAQSLVTRSTRTLGVYIATTGSFTGIGNSFEGTLLSGVEQACQQHGYHILLMNWSGPSNGDVCLQHLAAGRIDGLLLLRVPEDDGWIGQLLDETPHVVAIDYLGKERRIDVAAYDHAAAASLAVDHLVAQGHRRIGWIGCTDSDHNAVQIARLDGFRAAMARHGLPIDPRWVFDSTCVGTPVPREGDYLQEEGALAAKHFASLGDARPTAAIAAVFLSALGVFQASAELGLRVPGDLSVVGIGDRPWCAYTNPPLTAVANPLLKMGRWAAERLIARTTGEAEPTADGAGVRTNFQPWLIERGSTAAPAPEPTDVPQQEVTA